MTVSAKELRAKPSQLIEQAARGTEVIITLRGKKSARLVPFDIENKVENDLEDEIFGLWKDRKDITDINEYVRNIRRGRKF